MSAPSKIRSGRDLAPLDDIVGDHLAAEAVLEGLDEQVADLACEGERECQYKSKITEIQLRTSADNAHRLGRQVKAQEAVESKVTCRHAHQWAQDSEKATVPSRTRR